MSKIREADLAWIAAERAMQAADQSDDPLVLASAARSGTHALLSVGRYDDAMQLGQTAAAWLAGQVKNGDEEALSLLGMLFLRSAVAAARQQDRGETRGLLGQAKSAAERLGRDVNYWQTGFGPTNVRLHELSTALDLGDVAEVVEHRVDRAHRRGAHAPRAHRARPTAPARAPEYHCWPPRDVPSAELGEAELC